MRLRCGLGTLDADHGASTKFNHYTDYRKAFSHKNSINILHRGRVRVYWGTKL
jgi:hypothetical protein